VIIVISTLINLEKYVVCVQFVSNYLNEFANKNAALLSVGSRIGKIFSTHVIYNVRMYMCKYR